MGWRTSRPRDLVASPFCPQSNPYSTFWQFNIKSKQSWPFILVHLNRLGSLVCVKVKLQRHFFKWKLLISCHSSLILKSMRVTFTENLSFDWKTKMATTITKAAKMVISCFKNEHDREDQINAINNDCCKPKKSSNERCQFQGLIRSRSKLRSL